MSRGVKWILTNVITHFKMQSLEHSETLIWCKLDIKTRPTVSWFEGKSILHLLPNFFLNLFKTMYIKRENFLETWSSQTAWLVLLRKTYTHHKSSLFDHQIQKQHSNIEENGPMPGVIDSFRLFLHVACLPQSLATHFQLMVIVASLLQNSNKMTLTSSIVI